MSMNNLLSKYHFYPLMNDPPSVLFISWLISTSRENFYAENRNFMHEKLDTVLIKTKKIGESIVD